MLNAKGVPSTPIILLQYSSICEYNACLKAGKEEDAYSLSLAGVKGQTEKSQERGHVG